MRNNILTLLVGFVVMLGSVMLFKLGLDKMTDADAALNENYAQVNVDLDRRAILYRVKSGDTLWSLAERFYGEGKRWESIARANNMSEAEGLVAGAIIKIPVGGNDKQEEPGEAEPEPTITTSYDDVQNALDAGRFGLSEDTIDVTICRMTPEVFPSGALCVARHSEQQTVRLALFDAEQGGDSAPMGVYEAPAGNFLRELSAEDIDGDGDQEIYTIWQTDTDPYTSRVLKWTDEGFQVVSETPDDPLALLRLRHRE